MIKLVQLVLAASLLFGAVANAVELPSGILRLDGSQAPALELESLDGEKWSLAQARGNWVFLHFWASWCGPCRKEMPTIQGIVPEFENSALKIVLINTAETEDQAFEFIGAVAPDLDTLLDLDGAVTAVWQPRGLPASFMIDPEGRLRYLALGGRDWESGEYLEFLRSLLHTVPVKKSSQKVKSIFAHQREDCIKNKTNL